MEKKCRYKRSDIWLYIQNRMSREEEAEFQRHLITCDDCKEELLQLRSIILSIQRKERRRTSFRNWMIVASVACILLGGGVYCYYNSIQKGNDFLPTGGEQHHLKINTPVLHNDRDSIASEDSLCTDTMSVVFYE